MKSYRLNGKPLSAYLKGFTGGVLRVWDGNLEVFADDTPKTPAEMVKAAGGGVVPPVSAKPPQAAKSGAVALPGPDGHAVTRLLEASEKEGARTLTEIAGKAIRRMLKDPMKALGFSTLFTPEEEGQLAEVIAATNATADLLGRARIRLRQKRAEETLENYDENEPTRFSEVFGGFSSFATTPATPAPIAPLAPTRAIAFFKRKVPTVRVNVHAFTQAQRDKAFWLANQTSRKVLAKVKAIILDVLATGQGTTDAPHLINLVLEKTGLAPNNPDYPRMVFRTNMMEAYRAGGQEERDKPDVQETFPIWRYLGIDDGREGEDHRPHFGQYFPSSVPFATIRNMYVVQGGRVVRDPTGKGRVPNCRCLPQDISRHKWARLKSAGAKIADGYVDPTENQPEQFSEIPPPADEVFTETQDDLVACGLAPALAKHLDLPEHGEITRANFAYGESDGKDRRCHNCIMFKPDIEGRLGQCHLFACLRARDGMRYNLMADVGDHQVCAAFSAGPNETPESDAAYLRDQARLFWKEHEMAKKKPANHLGQAFDKIGAAFADVGQALGQHLQQKDEEIQAHALALASARAASRNSS